MSKASFRNKGMVSSPFNDTPVQNQLQRKRTSFFLLSILNLQTPHHSTTKQYNNDLLKPKTWGNTHTAITSAASSANKHTCPEINVSKISIHRDGKILIC